jgi:hypothetical protein
LYPHKEAISTLKYSSTTITIVETYQHFFKWSLPNIV